MTDHSGARRLAERARSGRMAGQGASALKYDAITALLAHAQHAPPGEAAMAARLALLVTARYDWRAGTFRVAVADMARMWGVTERTAKRHLASWRERGWIELRRRASRGHVALHAIAWERVLADTGHAWEAVGPDFAARMSGPEQADGTVVPFPPQGAEAPAETRGAAWPAISDALRREDPARHAAWFARLEEAGFDGRALRLRAPSAFVASYVETHLSKALHAAACAASPGIRSVTVEAP